MRAKGIVTEVWILAQGRITPQQIGKVGRKLPPVVVESAGCEDGLRVSCSC
jgi:hypothetical protein